MGDTCAIVVAAGRSRRMGFDKLAAGIAGRPVVAHALLAFERCPDVAAIVVVASPERADWIRQAAAAAGVSKLAEIVPGGAERQDSVRSGVAAAASQASALLAVHDAARPLVDPGDIARVIDAARAHGAACAARRVVDTIKRSDAAGEVRESVDRTNLWAMETPQVFRRELLWQACAAVESEGTHVTDEVSAAQQLGIPVRLVESERPNPKITVPSDIALCEALLRLRGGAGPTRE